MPSQGGPCSPAKPRDDVGVGASPLGVHDLCMVRKLGRQAEGARQAPGGVGTLEDPWHRSAAACHAVAETPKRWYVHFQPIAGLHLHSVNCGAACNSMNGASCDACHMCAVAMVVPPAGVRALAQGWEGGEEVTCQWPASQPLCSTSMCAGTAMGMCTGELTKSC